MVADTDEHGPTLTNRIKSTWHAPVYRFGVGRGIDYDYEHEHDEIGAFSIEAI
jgi:hypothetical protein